MKAYNKIKVKLSNKTLYNYETLQANNFCKTYKMQIIGSEKQTTYQFQSAKDKCLICAYLNFIYYYKP